MIKLNRKPIPESLTQNAANWTASLLEELNRGETISACYNLPCAADTKDILKETSQDKCMYCESKISHITYAHIEHIKPKSKYPQHAFEWSNFGLCCPTCNINKSDQYDEEFPFIDPYSEEPNDFLKFQGNFVFPKAGSQRAEVTIQAILLNRPELIERRLERIKLVGHLIQRYFENTNPFKKSLILNEIKIEIARDKEFSLCIKTMCENLMEMSLD